MYQHQYQLLNDKFELIKTVSSFVAALKASKQYKALTGQFAVIVKNY
jgi:hypothetical protein